MTARSPLRRIARAIALDALAIGLRLPGGALLGLALAPALAVGAVVAAGETRSALAQRLLLEEVARREEATRAAEAEADPDCHPRDF